MQNTILELLAELKEQRDDARSRYERLCAELESKCKLNATVQHLETTIPKRRGRPPGSKTHKPKGGAKT